MSDAMKPLIFAASEGPLSRAQAEAAFGYLFEGTATPAQIGGFLMALRARDQIWAHNRAILAKNLDLAADFFGRSHGGSFRWLAPQGGSVAFPELCRNQPVEELARVFSHVPVALLPAHRCRVEGGQERQEGVGVVEP